MKLSITMGQTPQAKTIAFAMKCLAISLLMAGEYGFDFSHIPIPVDSRIRLLMQKLAPGELKRNGEVQCFWSEILRELKAEIPKLSMIHLDSLCWQIGTLSESELRTYFKRLGLPEVAEKLINMIQANNYLHINKRTK
jgi:DNA-(apurinic or apyrimidinic site) lyase